MRRKLIEDAAFEVATQVRTVEDSIDSALVEIAELQSKLVHARSVTGAGIATGHGAFEELAASIQALVAARGGMVRCHASLIEAKGKVPGLRTVSFGESQECPPQTAFRDLRIVA